MAGATREVAPIAGTSIGVPGSLPVRVEVVKFLVPSALDQRMLLKEGEPPGGPSPLHTDADEVWTGDVPPTRAEGRFRDGRVDRPGSAANPPIRPLPSWETNSIDEGRRHAVPLSR
jgi:hypothetical protein